MCFVSQKERLARMKGRINEVRSSCPPSALSLPLIILYDTVLGGVQGRQRSFKPGKGSKSWEEA